MSQLINSEDILNQAASEHVTAAELDILVASTCTSNAIRERETQHLQLQLERLEIKLQAK